jgi:hypothetical protein
MTHQMRQHSDGDLFIVDNNVKGWTMKDYLQEWADLARTFDVATGCFEFGTSLALDSQWQKLDKPRILIGDEFSMRARKAMLQHVQGVQMKVSSRRGRNAGFVPQVTVILKTAFDNILANLGRGLVNER